MAFTQGETVRRHKTLKQRLSSSLLLVLTVLGVVFAAPAIAQAAELEAAFGPTLTGSEPFDATAGPGNDTGPANNVIRTNDIVTYTWAVSVNDGASPNTTVTQTLPVGMAWETPLPAFCSPSGSPPSSISADRRTIICNLGDKDSSSGSADQYPVVAKVLGDVANGTSFDTNFTVSSSDPSVPDASPEDPVTVQVSAAPRVNLIKSAPNPIEALGYHNGVWGQFITYPVSLAVDSLNGKGTKGNELIETPVGFEDAFTLTPASPGADFELVGCGPNTGSFFGGLPVGNGTGNNATPNSGTPTCVQAAPGADISFSFPANANLKGEQVPTRTANNSVVPANRAYLATYYMRVFVPNADIVASGGALRIQNTYEDFEAESISGQANVEPLEDNSQQLDLDATDPQPGTISIAKWFSPSGSHTTQWGNNQHVYPDSTFWAVVGTWTAGQVPIPAGTVAICDMFDNTTYNLTLDGTVGSDPAQPAWMVGNAAGTGSNSVVEYGTGGTRGHDAAGWAATRPDDCSNGASPTGWTTDPSSVPGGMDQITKVRVRFLAELPAGVNYLNGLVMNVKARNTSLGTSDLLPAKTILGNFAKLSTNQNLATPTWSGNTFNPENAAGSVGRRIFLSRGDVRIAKDTIPSGRTTALSGDVINYTLNVTATGEDLPDGIMRDVVVTDDLDRYQTYVPGSASPAPTNVVDNGDGTTTLIWELGNRPVNEAIPPITYEARIALNTPNNRDVINVAVVSSPEDASAVGNRTDQHEIRVSQIAGILIQKTTSTPWVEPGDQLEFQINYVNNTVTDLNGMESIDVLPYNGDARGSDFSGTARLNSVQVYDGQDVYYTARPSAEVSNNPKDPSNGPGGSTVWCLQVDLGSSGCPATIADSTAVKVVNDELVERYDSFIYDIVLDTTGNLSGDIYGNNAGLSTPDPAVILTAYSPVVRDQVVSSALGDYYWYDLNQNGIQDSGEPPVVGATVTLTGTNKHGQVIDLTTTTDPDGRYLFSNLVSGDYQIQFELPDGYEFTQRRAGSDPELNSSVFPASGNTGPIVIDSPVPLQEDQEDLTWDAGIFALPGSITIIKDARPNENVDFGFTTSGGLSPASFDLNDDGSGNEDRIVFPDLESGTYEVTEADREGWTLESIECTGTAESTVSGGTASIEIAPGQDAVCTFVNTKNPPPPGSITIIKDARPNADVDFGFTTSGGLDPDGFSLNDDGSGEEDRILFPDLAAGTYGVTESRKQGWTLTDISCIGGARSTVTGRSVAIELEAGTSAVCTFVNVRNKQPRAQSRIILDKRADLKRVRPGKVVTYTIGFRNVIKGTVAKNVLICDDIPRWTSVAGLGSGFFRNGEVCWRINRVGFSRKLKTRKLRLRIDRDAPSGTKVVNRVWTKNGQRRVVDRVPVRVIPDRGGVGNRPGGVTG